MASLYLLVIRKFNKPRYYVRIQSKILGYNEHTSSEDYAQVHDDVLVAENQSDETLSEIY